MQGIKPAYAYLITNRSTHPDFPSTIPMIPICMAKLSYNSLSRTFMEGSGPSKHSMISRRATGRVNSIRIASSQTADGRNLHKMLFSLAR